MKISDFADARARPARLARAGAAIPKIDELVVEVVVVELDLDLVARDRVERRGRRDETRGAVATERPKKVALETRSLELERALIAGFDDGFVREGP